MVDTTPKLLGAGGKMDAREAKALEIAARMRLTFKDDLWTVPSQSGKGPYKVRLAPDGNTCSCDDYDLRRQDCKHILAAKIVRERDGGEKAPPIDTDAIPRRPTYPQRWGLYNLAQSTEKHRFQELLCDLCKGLPPAERKAVGRKPLPPSDIVFACVFKIYCTLSTRRFACDLADAHAAGYLSRPMHYNSVNGYLETETLTPMLKALIARSAQPLRVVETEFAADSSGFSSSRFERWYDEKYGATRSGHAWVKAHIMTGVKSNVVTAIEIFDRDANDCPQFRPLLKTTAESFTVEEASADKAYSSRDNVEALDALGAFPAIPFRSNATGAAGGAFERLFYYYSYHREEFLKTYHKRSNVESTFSMVKAKFKDSVRSRTEPAMTNEVLCKFLAHNICCVLMSQLEFGVEAEFWPDAAKGEGKAVILSMKSNAGK